MFLLISYSLIWIAMLQIRSQRHSSLSRELQVLDRHLVLLLLELGLLLMLLLLMLLIRRLLRWLYLNIWILIIFNRYNGRLIKLSSLISSSLDWYISVLKHLSTFLRFLFFDHRKLVNIINQVHIVLLQTREFYIFFSISFL
jgi:hypothetical protein